MPDAVIRRLGPGDEAVLVALAVAGDRYAADDEDDAPEIPLPPADAAAFLADPATHALVAFGADDPPGAAPWGFVVANELRHRHTFARMILVYEIGVAREHRRSGVGVALLDAVRSLAVERGVPEGFVLTNESNRAAMALYAAAGGTRPSLDVVEWDFDYRR